MEVKDFYLFVFYTVLGDSYIVKGNNMVQIWYSILCFWGYYIGVGGREVDCCEDYVSS